jgi:hypothetical protein
MKIKMNDWHIILGADAYPTVRLHHTTILIPSFWTFKFKTHRACPFGFLHIELSKFPRAGGEVGYLLGPSGVHSEKRNRTFELRSWRTLNPTSFQALQWRAAVWQAGNAAGSRTAGGADNILQFTTDYSLGLPMGPTTELVSSFR